MGRLVPTATTNRNLALLGAALCYDPHPPPILVCGSHGSGKSSLIRELLHLCRPKESLIEFHIDEETDSKTLIGSYTTTDIPGEFAWRAGALTNACREGRWVLIEDLDGVPMEIQAALVKLFEERMIPLGNGKYERCHPNFRIFATCTTTFSSLRIGSHRGGGKQILNPSYWRNVHVKPMPFSELKEVAISLYPDVPTSVIDSAMTLLQTLDRSGRESNMDCKGDDSEENGTDEIQKNAARVRDMWAQRTLCMAESVDIFMGSCSGQEIKDEFIGLVAAPVWGITGALALNYIRARKPSVLVAEEFFEIGRARFNATKSIGFSQQPSATFAETNHALRLMESIAVCVRENEPILLVGETGCGKTTNIQQLAVRCERTLVVQNLSLQTDSTDLLGGYRPLEIQNVARNVYKEFVDTFVSSFSRKQNLKFLQYASLMLEKSNWKKLSQSFKRAAQLGLKKIKERQKNSNPPMSDSMIESWQNFAKKAERFERQRVSCDAGLAFEFAEGALVDAIQTGKWVLLDEINLASSDTLQRLCGLLDEPTGSLTLTERGDASAIKRHPNFRLFAAMNPATDAGKKDLPASIRCRFSEIYVDELLDPIELRLVAARCLDGVLPNEGNAPEHTEIVACIVDQYLRCRELAQTTLSDGNGHKPRYTLRTLSRALKAAKNLVVQQRIRLKVAMYEGFQLSFEGILDSSSIKIIRKMLKKVFLQEEARKIDLDHPGKRPGGRGSENEYVLIKPFWIKAGPLETTDWSEIGANGKSKFILTKTALTNLRRLAQALATGPWPILLEGPTSSGKTTLVEYIAARCGHHVVRINNHEHTDVQEYTGAFAADQNGSLSFRDGILLNLAPSEVLEALNRLLDDNRELYLAETNETVKPHPNFRLFATQNPSGAYGGRKPLSRAFRNRFVELHVGDIPSDEMSQILEKRCGCPPSHAKLLVKIMVDLRLKRSKSNLFLGKDSFITPRDLLRWAERHSGSKKDLAEHGYMVLAERLRSEEEKQMVLDVLEEHTKVKINLERLYYHEHSESRKLLDNALIEARRQDNHLIASIAPTRSMLRLIHLVSTCVRQKEPVLLVGDTGCGKTTVIQLLSFMLNQMLYSVNCHATTETSDLIGGLRPIEDLGRRYRALFEWSDGPLVKSMKSGQLMLLDEMSLAEDAVLERLNSVLEPSRCIVLAEKGDDGSSDKGKDDRIIVAHDSFRIFATMNPGGDYGKRELSPALRSRFTEIWVPSLRERSDFEIVMGRSFTISLGHEKSFNQSSIIGHILDYVEWFNSDMCGAASSPYSGFSLSLRDILSWAHFIVEAKKSNAKLTICDALYHGACLMHLDGLGLGSGLASDSSTTLKIKAEKRLLGLVKEGKVSSAHSVDEPICIQNGKFGVPPYFIKIGQCPIPKSNFDMTAPTTSLNAFRVLRAMQLRKPILLEGSPGVGKTSLVNALASASGNKLVRINLSEQTDISDLMGSDLPVESSTNNGPSFEWCDGVLLTAIKEGSWVLLDELNLASQAVLEGLNSCLDHRATMYIPELGKSFDCPSTFRIFAAQNPLGQGGGRKGLPKSFLNRFTKVYVDALTDSDLRSIVSSRFKSFSEEFVNQIIDFNNDIHQEVVDRQEYGSDGGPWEFNLRDVFRWCELIEAGHSSYAAGARDLYYQRFRTQNDRDQVDKTFQKHFGCSMIPEGSPEFEVLDSSVRIGETHLSRLDQSDQAQQTQRTIRESDLLFSRLVPTEAVARCINLRWPCLLVGGSGTGKTSIISSLAGLCNATLVEHCLTPSSDVSELVGGFEQSETMSKEIQILRDVCDLANNVVMTDAFRSTNSKSCLDVMIELQKYINDWDNSSLTHEDQVNLPWKKQEDSGHFVWRDGILVEALLKGHWLLLENANLCPASVLDRLNSVTERDGFFLLSESGTQESEDSTHSHRMIKPHKNFRIFFTMNAASGEISRAMRNRCVEISLLE
eukprot:jgi/Psemu1/180444/e_gw1.15.197.1